jgi:DNA-binding HxlR family transcriptional regulator
MLCQKWHNQIKLTVAQVKGGAEPSARAGAQVLSLIAEPLNVAILDAVAPSPRSLLDLRRAAGSPPQTTMRARLRDLTELGVLTKRRQNDFPGTLDYELALPGRELRAVAEVVRSWLRACPEGPIELGTPAAKSAIKSLVEAWSTSMIRALSARPLSLIELNRVIGGVSYPSLERRLSAMHLTGQIVKRPGQGRGTPYAVTDWLRQAIAPLAAAAHWERLRLGTAAAITNRDAEAAFLMALPLLRLYADLTGVCRFTVEFASANGSRLAGVLVEIEAGRVVSCVSRLQGETSAWASGSAGDWLRAVMERDLVGLELGGDRKLAAAAVDGLHGALCRPSPKQ